MKQNEYFTFQKTQNCRNSFQNFYYCKRYLMRKQFLMLVARVDPQPMKALEGLSWLCSTGSLLVTAVATE